MKALLIIDMQKISFTPKSIQFDADGVVSRINTLSEKFRDHGDLVIFIQHDGTKENYCFPGTEEWKILPALVIKPNDLFISKTANDAFYNSSLKEILSKNNIKDIIITGCATDFCVDSTIKSAFTKDYNITVISDGHTTKNRDEIKAKQIIDYYNWLWKELAPTEGKIDVIDFNNFIKTSLN